MSMSLITTTSKKDFDAFIAGLHTKETVSDDVQIKYVGPQTDYGAEPGEPRYFYQYEVKVTKHGTAETQHGSVFTKNEATYRFRIPTTDWT